MVLGTRTKETKQTKASTQTHEHKVFRELTESFKNMDFKKSAGRFQFARTGWGGDAANEPRVRVRDTPQQWMTPSPWPWSMETSSKTRFPSSNFSQRTTSISMLLAPCGRACNENSPLRPFQLNDALPEARRLLSGSCPQANGSTRFCLGLPKHQKHGTDHARTAQIISRAR